MNYPKKGEMCDNAWGPLRKLTNKCISLKSVQKNCLRLHTMLFILLGTYDSQFSNSVLFFVVYELGLKTQI